MIEFTQVRLRRETCEALKAIGEMGDSYDSVIRRLLDERKK
jgi:hypothetical protein